jgi:methionyl-tRNA formyltransferase
VLSGLTVAAGEGAVDVLEVQAEGRSRQHVTEFLRGATVAPGTKLGDG